MNFAYLDKYGILHVIGDVASAQKYAEKTGVVAVTEHQSIGGFPVVNLADGKEDTIVVYSLDEAYVNGNKGDGDLVNLKDFPDVEKLYKEVM